jgi:hypothetical protein
MSHGSPRHKKRHREKRSSPARPQLVLQPPIPRDNPLAGMRPHEELLPPAADIFRRFDTSTNKLIEAIEEARAQQRRALHEAIEAIS